MTPSSPRTEAASARLRRRRRWGWALVAYGVLGLLIVAVGAVVGIDAAGRIERIAGSADETLAAAARSTRAAAASFTSVDRSLIGAEAATASAAELSREASTTLARLSAAMAISIFGAQPLLPLAEDFERVAGQADDVASSLEEVGASLADARTDAAAIGDELASLADELEELRASAGSGAAPPIRLLVALVLAWITLPAVGALVVGTELLRRD